MTAKNQAESFIRRARREQLTEAAIMSLARSGASGASISAIAREADVSRGVVTYHFADLAAVTDQVIATIYARGRAAVRPLLERATGPAERLEAFIRGSIAFYADRRSDMAALQVIFTIPLAGRDARPEHRAELAELTTVLEDGQRSGAFRRFDPALMAAVVRAALDTAAAQISTGTDPAWWADELSLIVDRATRP